MTQKNKIIIYVIAAIVIVSIIATATVFILKTYQNSSNSTQQNNKISADAIKLDAIKVSASDPAKAKILYEQALKEYQNLGDTHNVNDVTMQLKILEYQSKQK